MEYRRSTTHAPSETEPGGLGANDKQSTLQRKFTLAASTANQKNKVQARQLKSPTEYQPKDNFEKVQTPAPVEPTTLYSQMGNGRVVNSQRRAQGAGTGSARPLSVKKMSSEKQGYDSSTATREQAMVLPNIQRASSQASESQLRSRIGAGLKRAATINVAHQPQIQQIQVRHADSLRNLQSHRRLSQVRNSDEGQLQAMNARFEQSKGGMSPSPEIRAHPPTMLSNLKNQRSSTDQAFATNKKLSPGAVKQRHPMEQDTYSFIEAPPIPYQKRYQADIRQSDSTRTVLKNQNSEPVKFRRNVHHPEQPEQPSQQKDIQEPLNSSPSAADVKDSEYYAMAGQPVGKATSKTASLKTDELSVGTAEQDKKSARSSKKHPSQQLLVEDTAIVQSKSNTPIRYATPPADKHESSSNKEQPTDGPSAIEHMQKSIERQKTKKIKTMSDSSALNMNSARAQMLSLIAGQLEPIGISKVLGHKSQLYHYGQEERLSNLTDVENDKALIESQNSHKSVKQPTARSGARTSNVQRSRSNYLFDDKNSKSKMIGVPSELNDYQESIASDALSTASMSDICMQIVTQALSKCYNIVPQLACQIIKDTRDQISHYRNQTPYQSDPSQNKRVILSPHESSIFFNTISDRFYQKAELIIEKGSDLRPVLSMILLGIQGYQSEKTKVDALKCIKFLAEMNQGHFRPKIWHWVKYTTMKQPKADAQSNYSRASRTSKKSSLKSSLKSSKAQVHVQGFIHSVHDVMSLSGNTELSVLACRTLVQIAQKSLFELFLSQLPTLFTDRAYYLKMINEHIQMYISAMRDQVDEIERKPLLQAFNKHGISNFLVAQCLCLIEGNLMTQRENLLEDFAAKKAGASSKSKSRQFDNRIQEEHTVAVSLITEIWTEMPEIFSSPEQNLKMLNNEYDEDDFGLNQRLNTAQPRDQRKRLLGSKVLSMFKKISEDATLTLRLNIISRLFAILENSVKEMDDFAETIYRLLVFFLVEWHENKVLRSHLMSNFTQLFKHDKFLSLEQLIEPLCRIIHLNLQKDDLNSRTYLTMSDFSFFWELANSHKMTLEGALSICRVMQIYMLKRDPQYRGVAEKIFFKLLGNFQNDQQVQEFVQNHADDAVIDLATVDQAIKAEKNERPLSPNSSRAHLDQSESFEMQLQLHYLFKHLLLLARGKRVAAGSTSAMSPGSDKEDPGYLMDALAFRQLGDYIVATLQNTIRLMPGAQQGGNLVSLLKKLTSDESRTVDSKQNLLTEPEVSPIMPEMNQLEVKEQLNSVQSFNSQVLGTPIDNVYEEDQQVAVLPQKSSVPSSEHFAVYSAEESKARQRYVDEQVSKMTDSYENFVDGEGDKVVSEVSQTKTSKKSNSDFQTHPRQSNVDQFQSTVLPIIPIVEEEAEEQPSPDPKGRYEQDDQKGPAQTQRNPQIAKLSQQAVEQLQQQVSNVMRDINSIGEPRDSGIRRTAAITEKSTPSVKKSAGLIHAQTESRSSYNRKSDSESARLSHVLDKQMDVESKVDIREELEKITAGLESAAASMDGLPEQNYDDYRLKKYASDGGGPGEETSDGHGPPAPLTERAGGIDDLYKHQPTITMKRYPSKQRILVSLDKPQEEPINSARNLGSALGVKQCLHCAHNGVDTTQHETEKCPWNKKLNQLLAPDHRQLARNKQKGRKLLELPTSQSQAALMPIVDENGVPTYVGPRGFRRNAGSQLHQSQKILTLNKLPQIVGHGQMQVDPSSHATLVRTSSRNISQGTQEERPSAGGLGPADLSVYRKGPEPRSQQFGGLPITLPRVSDLWRGNQLGSIVYGDEINYQTQGQAPPTGQALRPRFQSLNVGQHQQLAESQSSYGFQRHRQLVHPSNQAADQSRPDGEYADLGSSPAGRGLTKTGASWVSGALDAAPCQALRIHNKKDRKDEIKRLENSLEAMLIGLGAQVERYSTFKEKKVVVPEQVKVEEPTPKRKHIKKEEDDNKVSAWPAPEESIEEPIVDSYIISYPYGYIGIGNGTATPPDYDIQADEVVELTVPLTFDPTHPGAVNLSPIQLEQLKKLAHMEDEGMYLTPAQRDELESLLDLLENGTAVDGRHPGMVNLTPEQQQQFLKLYEADVLNSPPLSPDKKKQLDTLKNLIVHGIPLDSNHPGVVNLSPDQKKHLIEIEKRQARGQVLRPAEEQQLSEYKNLIAHGQPIDSSHPGVVNLTEDEKDMLRAFESKGADRLSPAEKEIDDRLRNTIVTGIPLDETHSGMCHLSPLQAKQFSKLLDGAQSPGERKQLCVLQKLLQDGSPVDDEHAGFAANLTPNQQDQFRTLTKKQMDSDDLSPDAQKKLDDLKNQIVHGKPLDTSHGGMCHLTHAQKETLSSLLSKRTYISGPLPADDKKILQNIQNLMLNGAPLDEDHPGYKKLSPKDQHAFKELMRNPKIEDTEKLDRLLGAIQLGSGPYNMQHEGIHNLTDRDQKDLAELLEKERHSTVPLHGAEKKDLERMKEIMRPHVPYDRVHPGFEALDPEEQVAVCSLNKKIEDGKPLLAREKEELKRLHERMKHPVAIDEDHPGWDNLTPKEKTRFKRLAAKEDDGDDLTQREQADLDKMKDIIRHGRPIDETHPGFDNLNPEQQARFRELFQMRADGKAFDPEQAAMMASLEDIIVNGIPIDENHPGFVLLDPYEKKRFKNLFDDREEGDLTPEQQKEFDLLRMKIAPSTFTSDMSKQLKALLKQEKSKAGLNADQMAQKAYLEELQRKLPNDEEEIDGLSPDERALLIHYLAMRLYEQPMTPQQEDELAALLDKEIDFERTTTEDEVKRLKELVQMKYRGTDLGPEEEKELFYLNQKQYKDIGNLTPGQNQILLQRQEDEESGQILSPEQQQQLDFFMQLKDLPSILSPDQEKELSELEEKSKKQAYSQWHNLRMKALQRMKYHPQMLNLENKALLYLLKDIDSLPELSLEQEDMRFALQKHFNCVPYINMEQLIYRDDLEEQQRNGHQLSPRELQDLARLHAMPCDIHDDIDVQYLDTAAECRAYKYLKAKQDRGEDMDPSELQRLKELSDKIQAGIDAEQHRLDEIERLRREAEEEAERLRREAEEEAERQRLAELERLRLEAEEEERLRREAEAEAERLRLAAEEEERLRRLAEEEAERLRLEALERSKMEKKVSYAPLPIEREASLRLPSPMAIVTPASHAKSTMPVQGEDLETEPTEGKNERQLALLAFKKAIKRGNCTLKELVDQFFIIEEQYIVLDYLPNIKKNFVMAANFSNEKDDKEDAGKPLNLKEFLKYSVKKKIKFRQHHIVEILKGDSEQESLSLKSFVKLYILASCGGDRTKIGVSNFRKLMNHMDITKG